MFRTFLAPLAIALSTMPALADDAKLPRTISLSGQGEVRAAPDIAVLSLGVTTNAPSAKEAVDANSASMKALLEALKAAGVADKDMQTSNFVVSPRYDYSRSDGSAPQQQGFDATNSVTVTVRNINDLGRILDSSVAAGSNQINGISFGLDKPQPVMDEARKLAVADAKRKAELYASAARVSLGNIIQINEGGGYQPPAPIAQFSKSRAEAADVPIAAGEQVIVVDVNITWEIR
jgi:uncharacterized protein